MATEAARAPQIVVYGADWCPMTTRVRQYLQELQIPFQYINIDHDREAAAWVAEQNGGKEKKPTLRIGRRVLSTPSESKLDAALAESSG